MTPVPLEKKEAGKQPRHKSQLAIIFVALFDIMVGFGIIIPTLPYYIKEFGASASDLGLVFATYSLMHFLFAPLWGRLSDSYGRKPVFTLGLFGFSVSYVLLALADSLFMVYVARIAGGILSAAALPTAFAYVSDTTAPEARGRTMGIISSAMGLGMIVGPVLGGLSSQVSQEFPFLLAALIAGATGVGAAIFLRETLATGERKAETHVSKLAAWHSPLQFLYLVAFLSIFSLATLEVSFAWYAQGRFNWSATEAALMMGYAFMAVGISVVITQGLLVGRLLKAYSEHNVLRLGIIVMGASLFMVILSPSFVVMIGVLVILGFGAGLIRPANASLISKNTKVGQGLAMGLYDSFDSLGRIFGPLIGGIALGWNPSYPFLVGGIVMVLTFFASLSLFVVKRDTESRPSIEPGV